MFIAVTELKRVEIENNRYRLKVCERKDPAKEDKMHMNVINKLLVKP